MSAERGRRPVATTTAVAVPLTTDVPRKTRSRRIGPVAPARLAVDGLLLGRHRLAREGRLLHVEV